MGKTILVVDDSTSFRQVVGMALRSAGYEVVEACDGKDALGKLDGSKYHLIVSDVNMPVMDGISFVKEAKQLSSYGGSLELACTDLTHYLTSGYRVMVLCGGEVRARNLRRMLADRKIPAAVDLSGEKSPEKGTVLIAVGALSAGCEYPEGRLAVLTEGQLTTPLSGRSKKPRPKRDSNQQKLQSYTDLTPGDLVVHAHHGIGRFVAMLRLPVDGVEKDYIKIAYAGSDCLFVPATRLDLVSKYIGAGADNEHAKENSDDRNKDNSWEKTTGRPDHSAR